METIKEEPGICVKAEATLTKRDGPCSLWEGKVKVKLEKENREIQVPIQIFHKDAAKNGQKLFDWTTGKRLINYLQHYATIFRCASISCTDHRDRPKLEIGPSSCLTALSQFL